METKRERDDHDDAVEELLAIIRRQHTMPAGTPEVARRVQTQRVRHRIACLEDEVKHLKRVLELVIHQSQRRGE